MNRRSAFALGLLAGGASALGHVPFSAFLGLVPALVLSLAGFTGLFFLMRLTERPVLVAWAAGTGYFGLSLHWIVEPFLVQPDIHGWMAPFALVLMAGGLALFWAFGAFLARRLGLGAIGFALAIALGEMARGYLFTGFPWALPAYIWADTPFMPLAAVFGPYGMTALTLLVGAVGAELQARDASARVPTFAVILCVVAGSAVARLPALLSAEVESAPLGTVLLVQPDARQEEKWDPEKGPAFVRSMIEMSAEASGGAADLVIWPEAAVPYPLDLSEPILTTASASAGGTPLITGLNRREGEAWFNALVLVGQDGRVSETYDKVHLVPFGEYIPFRIELLRAMAAMSNFGFSKGAGVRLIDTPLGSALPLICYEAIFPTHGRGAGRPDVLIQITNDAWFGEFAGPHQHLQQARFRAVEQGVSMVRVANRGFSAVIAPDGQIVALSEPGAPSALLAEVPGPAQPSLYSRMGDLPVALGLLLAFAALGFRKSIASRARTS